MVLIIPVVSTEVDANSGSPQEIGVRQMQAEWVFTDRDGYWSGPAEGTCGGDYGTGTAAKVSRISAAERQRSLGALAMALAIAVASSGGVSPRRVRTSGAG